MTEGTLETIRENVCPMLQYGETSTELSQVRLTKQDHTWAILSQSIQLPVIPVTTGTLETIGENVCPLLHFCRNINSHTDGS